MDEEHEYTFEELEEQLMLEAEYDRDHVEDDDFGWLDLPEGN